MHAYLRGILEPPHEIDAAACIELQRIEVAARKQHEQRQIAPVEYIADAEAITKCLTSPGLAVMSLNTAASAIAAGYGTGSA